MALRRLQAHVLRMGRSVTNRGWLLTKYRNPITTVRSIGTNQVAQGGGSMPDRLRYGICVKESA